MIIYIPTPLRIYANAQDSVEVEASDVAGALEALTQAHPDLRKHLFTPEHPRPEELEFTHAELLLLSVWAKPERGHNVVAMLRRD